MFINYYKYIQLIVNFEDQRCIMYDILNINFARLECILVLYTYIIYTLFFIEQLKNMLSALSNKGKIMHFLSLMNFPLFY
jgi:hypothetical protein